MNNSIVRPENNPFSKVEESETFYALDGNGQVKSMISVESQSEDDLYSHCNYYNDAKFAKNVALHRLLHYKLLQFAYDNGLEDSTGNDAGTDHFVIAYDRLSKKYAAMHNNRLDYPGVVSFSTQEVAERAIEEVVKPFLKEYPDFVW